MFTIEELATIPLFSELGEKALEYLAGAVEDIHLIPGEYVAHEGNARALAVVVEGTAELTKVVNGVERVIGVRGPGELGGEVPMTLGTPLPASMRAVDPARVLKLTVENFHTLAAMAPQISAAVGAAALERMEMLRSATAQTARARDVRHRPAPRPGGPQLRQLPPPQSDSLRTPGPRRSRAPLDAPEWEPRSPSPIRWWYSLTAPG